VKPVGLSVISLTTVNCRTDELNASICEPTSLKCYIKTATSTYVCWLTRRYANNGMKTVCNGQQQSTTEELDE